MKYINRYTGSLVSMMALTWAIALPAAQTESSQLESEEALLSRIGIDPHKRLGKRYLNRFVAERKLRVLASRWENLKEEDRKIRQPIFLKLVNISIKKEKFRTINLDNELIRYIIEIGHYKIIDYLANPEKCYNDVFNQMWQQRNKLTSNLLMKVAKGTSPNIVANSIAFSLKRKENCESAFLLMNKEIMRQIEQLMRGRHRILFSSFKEKYRKFLVIQAWVRIYMPDTNKKHRDAFAMMIFDRLHGEKKKMQVNANSVNANHANFDYHNNNSLNQENNEPLHPQQQYLLSRGDRSYSHSRSNKEIKEKLKIDDDKWEQINELHDDNSWVDEVD